MSLNFASEEYSVHWNWTLSRGISVPIWNSASALTPFDVEASKSPTTRIVDPAKCQNAHFYVCRYDEGSKRVRVVFVVVLFTPEPYFLVLATDINI